jgi:hypothetical protein
VPSISRALGTQWVILQRTMALRFHSVHDSWAAPVAQGGAPGRELFARRRDVGAPRRVSVRPNEQDSGPVRRGGDRRPYDVDPVCPALLHRAGDPAIIVTIEEDEAAATHQLVQAGLAETGVRHPLAAGRRVGNRETGDPTAHYSGLTPSTRRARMGRTARTTGGANVSRSRRSVTPAANLMSCCPALVPGFVGSCRCPV